MFHRVSLHTHARAHTHTHTHTLRNSIKDSLTLIGLTLTTWQFLLLCNEEPPVIWFHYYNTELSKRVPIQDGGTTSTVPTSYLVKESFLSHSYLHGFNFTYTYW